MERGDQLSVLYRDSLGSHGSGISRIPARLQHYRQARSHRDADQEFERDNETRPFMTWPRVGCGIPSRRP